MRSKLIALLAALPLMATTACDSTDEEAAAEPPASNSVETNAETDNQDAPSTEETTSEEAAGQNGGTITLDLNGETFELNGTCEHYPDADPKEPFAIHYLVESTTYANKENPYFSVLSVTNIAGDKVSELGVIEISEDQVYATDYSEFVPGNPAKLVGQAFVPLTMEGIPYTITCP